MAKLVHYKDDVNQYVLLEAENGEEVSPEIVTAWATLSQSVALQTAAERLGDIADEIRAVAVNMD